MKGFTFPWEPLKEYKELLTVICRRCKVTWTEQIIHYGALAGYAREYDCCENCITDEEKKRLRVQE